MSGANPPRSVTPNAQQDYDVTRMREEDFERLAVYIVPDMPCEKGVPGRAEKTLPRSLTLKPSLVLSTPTSTVRITSPLPTVLECKIPNKNHLIITKSHFLCVFPDLSKQTEGVWSTGVIPRGTRFGPFEGVRTPSHPSDKQLWRYFWRVSGASFLTLTLAQVSTARQRNRPVPSFRCSIGHYISC